MNMATVNVPNEMLLHNPGMQDCMVHETEGLAIPDSKPSTKQTYLTNITHTPVLRSI